MRVLALLVLLVALVVPPSAAAAPRPRPDVRHALAVLHGWDERRARAWAASDAAGLRRLYVAGSTAARADVQLLDSYTARGLVVRRLVTQVFGVRVLGARHDRISLRVLDRVAGGVVVQGDREVPLPSSRPAVRGVDLVRTDDGWRVSSVSDGG